MNRAVLPLNDFLSLAQELLRRELDEDQRGIVSAEPGSTLFVVAGPGSGKTTVLALRVLRHILVDGMKPETIVATTFTRRAARELRSRILGWGDDLRLRALSHLDLADGVRSAISGVDFNAVITGTLDQLIEELLTRYRPPGSAPPVILESFVSTGLVLKRGLFEDRRFMDGSLREYAHRLGLSQLNSGPADLAGLLKEVRERWYHDQIDVARYLSERRTCTVCDQHPHRGIEVLGQALQAYQAALDESGLCDFELLEHRFLEALRSGRLDSFREHLCCVLVDEYQDTNLLQEAIYFEMASRCIANGGGLCVVGDDDQSLYRFRGATVDLFTAFPQRVKRQLGVAPSVHYLTNNYRSVPNIVHFVNEFGRLDEQFQEVRVQGKPAILPKRRVQHNPPVLGMFRDTVEELAEHLANFIYQVFEEGGVNIRDLGRVRKSPDGSVGDCAVLCSSPREYNAAGNPRLPLLLRQALGRRGIQVFNPRGQSLASHPWVGTLCGLLLECIDPEGAVAAGIQNLPVGTMRVFGRWRQQARSHISRNPSPRRPVSLRDFVSGMRAKARGARGEEISLTDLVYKLVTWIRPLQDDIEGLVYLEVVLRTLSASAHLNPFGGHVRLGAGESPASIRAAYWDFLVPIATEAVDVEEDLLDTLPADRVNILSIHQSKGLEFPMVIVDVGSAFQTNNWLQAPMRYPNTGGRPHHLEDELRQFSVLGSPARSGRDRAFDDLYRLYYVAYSRAQDLLILCGLNPVRYGRVPHVAVGWDRRGNWVWGHGLPNLLHV